MPTRTARTRAQQRHCPQQTCPPPAGRSASASESRQRHGVRRPPVHGVRPPVPQPRHVRRHRRHRRLGHQLQHRREQELAEGREAAGAAVPDLLPDRQPGDGVLRHLRAPHGRRGHRHLARRPARRQPGVPRQHDVRRGVLPRHLDAHRPRHGARLQGDQPQRQARQPAHLGGVHHHRDGDAAALRWVAPRRRARGHPGDAYRRSLTEASDDDELAGKKIHACVILAVMINIGVCVRARACDCASAIDAMASSHVPCVCARFLGN